VWYLEQKEAELQSQEDMDEQKSLARKVLKKMVKVCLIPLLPLIASQCNLLTSLFQTNVLLQIRGEGLADEAGQGLQETKTMYVVHPNCVVDDIGA
jgi:DNA replication licensing factor MCM6